MAIWLYQTSERKFGLNSYRLEIWENERWRWPVKRNAWIGAENPPRRGDVVVFFHAQTGFVGWAVVLRWAKSEEGYVLQFRPAAPSDHLKLDPWWDDDAKKIADEVRKPVSQKTLYPIKDELWLQIAHGVTAWLARSEQVSPVLLTPQKAALIKGVAALQKSSRLHERILAALKGNNDGLDIHDICKAIGRRDTKNSRPHRALRELVKQGKVVKKGERFILS